MRRGGASIVVLAALAAAGCTGGRAPGRETPALQGADSGAPSPTRTSATPSAAPSDGAGTPTIPAGFGSLRQEDVAIRIDLTDVQVRLIPLDESVIRVLSPDSYRALRDLLASRREEIDRLTRVHALREPAAWYATFHGVAPEARFNPTDVTITSAGREFRSLAIVPLSAGFGSRTVRGRETQSALLLFEDGIDLGQPLTVSMGARRSSQWADILRTVERERVAIRARAR